MASNFGAPPPPPPPPPPPQQGLNGAPVSAGSNGVGSQRASPAQYAHQQMHQPPMAHHAAPQGGYHPPQHAQYLYQQYPQHQYQQQYNQYQYNHQYRGYANYEYATAPPPPPPQHQSHNHHNHNIDQHSRGQNGHSTNADAAASLRQSEEGQPQNAKPKKVNPKMAKKYAGRGLKTITVSGPGMPTQRFKICVGNHPDDVRKWIEERRKRFPRSATTPEEKQKRRETQSERDRARNRQDRELRALGLTAPSHGSRYTSGGKTMDSSSLLQRLLQRDKEREHRLTLQLLRWIVDSNYFLGESAGKLSNESGKDDVAKEPE